MCVDDVSSSLARRAAWGSTCVLSTVDSLIGAHIVATGFEEWLRDHDRD